MGDVYLAVLTEVGTAFAGFGIHRNEARIQRADDDAMLAETLCPGLPAAHAAAVWQHRLGVGVDLWVEFPHLLARCGVEGEYFVER